MKKIIMAVAIVCAAVAANAATLKWGTGYEVMNGTDSDFTSATVAYMINSATLSQSDVYNAVIAGATLDEAVAGKYIGSQSMADGATSLQTVSDLATGSMKAYMVVFDSDLNALYFSEEMTKSVPGTGFATYKFENNSSLDGIAADMSGFDKSYGGWVSTAAVPEPTSGLLMLLGMAGLALRRRRS